MVRGPASVTGFYFVCLVVAELGPCSDVKVSYPEADGASRVTVESRAVPGQRGGAGNFARFTVGPRLTGIDQGSRVLSRVDTQISFLPIRPFGRVEVRKNSNPSRRIAVRVSFDVLLSSGTRTAGPNVPSSPRRRPNQPPRAHRPRPRVSSSHLTRRWRGESAANSSLKMP